MFLATNHGDGPSVPLKHGVDICTGILQNTLGITL